MQHSLVEVRNLVHRLPSCRYYQDIRQKLVQIKIRVIEVHSPFHAIWVKLDEATMIVSEEVLLRPKILADELLTGDMTLLT